MKTDRLPFWVLDTLVAGALLSRLPLPHVPQCAFAHTARAVWAYPLIGAVLGGIAGGLGLMLSMIGLPAFFAAGGVLAGLMLMTGGMHEDGLADTTDGFWGGFEPARRLEIMKDSHLGTYGLLGLIVVTGLRWGCYTALIPLGILPIIATAVLSRSIMACLMLALPHARTTGLSHSVGRPSERPVVIGLGIALLLAGWCIDGYAVLGLLSALGAATCLGILSRTKIAGQTGDVLGAAQQLAEVAILASLVVALT